MTADARFVSPIERLIYLRTLPAFGQLPPSELAAIAHHTRERFFKKGAPMMREGEPASSVFFLVEGRALMRRGGRPLRTVEAPFAVGFMPVLARDPDGVECVAEVDTLALELGADALLDVFEDNFSLVETGIRRFAKQLADVQRELELAGGLAREEPIETPYPERELDLVERLVLMRQTGPFRECSLEPLIELCRRVVEVRMEPGEVLWREGEPADWGLHVAHGVIRCSGDDGRSFRMGPGSIVGYSETYARVPRGYTATAESRAVFLRGSPEVFFDVLEDNVELGMSFLGFIARMLTRLYEIRGQLAP
jgi:CRP-like cAMP-binding protein